MIESSIRFRTGRLLALIGLCLGIAVSGLHAEPYPSHGDLLVNDLAEVIDGATTARLRESLSDLKDETGVEMTVLTIKSRDAYDPSASIEAFATGLFNDWGIGDASRNDGILILVATEDREARIELGAGYHQGFDVVAQDIVSRWMVPEFRDLRWSEGVEFGVKEIADRIARRHAESLAPEALPERSGEGFFSRFGDWIFGAVFVAIGALILFGQRIRDGFARFRRCPRCGTRGLHRHRRLATDQGEATTRRTGWLTTSCDNCDYRDERQYRLPSRQAQSGRGGSFGGGRSSGGGASGRW